MLSYSFSITLMAILMAVVVKDALYKPQSLLIRVGAHCDIFCKNIIAELDLEKQHKQRRLERYRFG